MKKLGLAVLGGAWLTLLWAAPALAGSELPQPPEVLGKTVRPPGGVSGSLAFTGAGATIRLWMVLAAAMLIAGAALLIATRRRRGRETE
jgi:hypothetical protein